MDDKRLSLLRGLKRGETLKEAAGSASLSLPEAESIMDSLIGESATGRVVQGSASVEVPSPAKPSDFTPLEGAYSMYVDGASRGNPGAAGAGAHIDNPDGTTLVELCRHLGEATNNIAEYSALLLGLKEAEVLGIKNLDAYADSELMVKQIKGIYRVKNEGLKPLYEEAKRIIAAFERFTISHVRREFNSKADGLANRGIDDG